MMSVQEKTCRTEDPQERLFLKSLECNLILCPYFSCGSAHQFQLSAKTSIDTELNVQLEQQQVFEAASKTSIC